MSSKSKHGSMRKGHARELLFRQGMLRRMPPPETIAKVLDAAIGDLDKIVIPHSQELCPVCKAIAFGVLRSRDHAMMSAESAQKMGESGLGSDLVMLQWAQTLDWTKDTAQWAVLLLEAHLASAQPT